jgi:hypothetical protein
MTRALASFALAATMSSGLRALEGGIRWRLTRASLALPLRGL